MYLSWVAAALMKEGLSLREGPGGQVDERCFQLHRIHVLHPHDDKQNLRIETVI